MSDRIAALELEVSELKEEVGSLCSEVHRLRRCIASLRADRGGSLSSYSAPVSSGLREESEDTYSLVSESLVREAEVARRPTPAPSSNVGHPVRQGALQLSWKEREDIADEVGRFLARSISGLHRGPSGRDKNPIASRLWIVVRDFSGQIYTPVRVFRTWSSCKLLCKPGGNDPGDSVFIGFPSEREGRRAIATAGLVWPDVVEQ